MTDTTDIKLIAIDLDGTLLTPELVIHPRTAEAVRAAVDRGVIVVIATGRMHSSAEPFARELGLDGPMVTYNGAMIRRPGDAEPIWHLPIPADLADEAIRLCVRERMDAMYFLDDEIYVPRYDRWAYEYRARTGNDSNIHGDLRSFAGNQPTKLLIMGTPEETAERYEFFAREFGDRLHATVSLPEYLELLHPEVSKASALSRLAEMLGFGIENVMAVGDSMNDLEMVEAAGVGVMMATSSAQLRAAADFVPQSAEVGVAETIERLILAPVGA